LVDIDREAHVEVVVAAVKEPSYGAELCGGGFIGVVYECDCGVVVDRFAHNVLLSSGSF